MNNTTDTSLIDSPLSRHMKLAFFSTLYLPSIVVSLHLLHCLRPVNRSNSKNIQNHFIIILLILCVIITTTEYLPFTATYLYLGHALSQTDISCKIWIFYSFTNFGILTYTILFGTIQRHLLIFKSSLFNIRKYRLWLHYIPFIMCFIYNAFLYFIFIFLIPCENAFQYEVSLCRKSCYLQIVSLNIYDYTMNSLITSLLISIFSTGLIVRVLQQKKKMSHTIQWRKQWKLTVQLISIVILILLIHYPLTVITFAEIFLKKPTIGHGLKEKYLFYGSMFAPLVLPFVCLSTLKLNKRETTQFRYCPLCLIGRRKHSARQYQQKKNALAAISYSLPKTFLL
jgi:hypothetical protein